MTSSGIEAASVRFFDPCLNQLCYCIPWKTVSSRSLRDAILMQLLYFWTLSIDLFLFKPSVSETGFCFLLQVEIRTDSIYWTQLIRFHLKTKTESSFRNAVFQTKAWRWIKSRNIIVMWIARISMKRLYFHDTAWKAWEKWRQPSVRAA
jgi:hypothetical protein